MKCENHIQFNWISISNFMSIKDEVEFSFSDFYGLNFIVGNNRDIENSKNGCGKSTIFCAATLFGLYGKTPVNVKKGFLVNRSAGKAAVIKIELERGADTYTIESGLHPTYVHITKNNNEDVTKHSIGETRKFIEEEIIGASFDMFKHSVVLSVSSQKSIFELSMGQKREFIEDIFDLNFLGGMFHKNRYDLNLLKKSISHLKIEFDTISDSMKSFDTKHKSFHDDKTEELNKIGKTVNAIKERITTYNDIIQGINHEKLSNAVNDINKKTPELEIKVDNIESDKRKLVNENKLHVKDIKHLNVLFKKYKGILEKVGDCCKHIVDKEFDISANAHDIQELKTVIDGNSELILEYDTNLTKLNTAIEKLTNAQASFEKKLNSYETARTQVEYNEEKLASIQNDYENLEAKESPFKELLNESTAKTNDIETQIGSLAKEAAYSKYIDYILSPAGIKSWIISKMIDNMNSIVSSYLNELGADYSVLFNSNLESTFLTTSGECDYNNFSSGEKMRINLAMTFAIRDILHSQGILSTSIIVCDEMIDASLDDVAIENVMKILKRISVTQSVFLISHKEVIESSETIDNVIEIVKENGQTFINESSMPNGS